MVSAICFDNETLKQIINEEWPDLKCSIVTSRCSQDGKVMSHIDVRFTAPISWEMPEIACNPEAVATEVRGKIQLALKDLADCLVNTAAMRKP